MPSYARKHQLTNSLTYHVFNRGNAKDTIFKSAEDCEYFLKPFKKYLRKFTLKIFHWVIMPNHFHLLLEISEPDKIFKFMAGLSLGYTKYHHKKYESCGYLWQGRFKSQPVQKEIYMIACARISF
jgi:putative transposase